MAVGATGTPSTNFAIPKYSTSGDAPNGTGFNSAVDFLDSLLMQAPMSSKIVGLTDGDIPIWDSATSRWIRPTGTPDGTKFLRDDGSWQTVATPLGYGTSLPGSPTDGQEYVLVDSLTSPSYQWRFRYNASNSTSFKWEFVGGAAGNAYIGTSEGTSSGTPTDLATVGPSFTVPRGGVYQVAWGAQIVDNGVGGGNAVVYLYGGASAATQLTSVQQNVTDINGAAVVASAIWEVTQNASDILRVRYSITNATGVNISLRFLTVNPRRVS